MTETILSSIYKVLQDEAGPLTAYDIQSKLTNIGKIKKNTNQIGTDQIRKRIRENPSLFSIDKGTSPNTYRIKPITSSLWVLKTVSEEKRALQTIDSYEDILGQTYNYNSFVPNHKQIAEGDSAILIDKKKILGFAKISSIKTSSGKKIMRRCPTCGGTTIDKRKNRFPIYRCNKGHTFDSPLDEEKSTIEYNAIFNFFKAATKENSLSLLKPFYLNGYNQNMSMQLLSNDTLSQFGDLYQEFSKPNNLNILEPDESYKEINEGRYIANDLDERQQILRAIRVRRGQQGFRKSLLKRFDNTCVVTGCKIIDILEAAHIKPYRGNNDNHISNGILLRADIHTLFDLNLVAIDPETLLVHFHPKVAGEYSEYHLRRIFGNPKTLSLISLTWRWRSKLF